MFRQLTRCYFTKNSINKYSTQRNFEEVKIPVPWGHIAGKWWHPSNQRPILTLHGWQDNCGSFDRLIPLLTDEISVLAIDLPGHGLSTRLPPGMYYNNLNYPILIRRLMDYLQWDKVTLMGHSLGAISCYTYTMLYSDSVDFLICLDGFVPLSIKDNFKRMPSGIDDYLKYDKLVRDDNEPPSYTLEEMENMLSEAFSGSVDIENTHYLLNRSVEQSKNHPDRFYFTRDPRLKRGPHFNWPQNDLIDGASRISTPILLMKCTESGYFENKQNFYEILDVLGKTSKDLQLHYVEGKHHHHLNHPERVHDLINDFIKKHNVCDRETGGIPPEIVV